MLSLAIIQHYFITLMLYWFDYHSICGVKASDPLYCIVKIDLTVDMVNYMTGTTLFLIIALRRQVNRHEYFCKV